MRQKKHLPSFIFLFFLVLPLLNSCSGFEESLSVKDGIADLQSYSFAKDDIYALNGEWEFYWQKAYSPQDFTSDKDLPEKSIISVPSVWHELPETNNEHVGYATYRLKILLPQDPPRLGMNFRQLATSANIFINGKLIESMGTFSTDKKSAVAHPQVVNLEFFAPPSNEIELLIQISNYDNFWSNGLAEPVLIGNHLAIRTTHNRIGSLELFFIGIFLIFSFYHFVLYFYYRSDLSNLLFALLTLDVGIRVLVAGERVITKIFPSMPYIQYIRLEYISWYIGAPLVLHFLMHLFRYFEFRKYIYFIYAVNLGFVAFALIAPPIYMTRAMVLFQIIFSLQMLSAFLILGKGWRDKAYGARILFLSLLFTFLALVYDMLNASGAIPKTGFSLAPIGIALFFYGQIAVLVYRFYNAFHKAATLTDELQTENMSLLQMDTRKDEFLLRSSAELKPSLKIIHSLSKYMLDEEKESSASEEKQNLELIAASSNQLLRKVNDILEFSKLTHDELDINVTVVDFSSSLDNVLDSWQKDVQDAYIKNYIEESSCIYADKRRLQQVIYNLLQVLYEHGDRQKIELQSLEYGELLEVYFTSSFLSAKITNIENTNEIDIANLDNSLYEIRINKHLIEAQKGKLTLRFEDGAPIGFTLTLPLVEKNIREKEKEEATKEEKVIHAPLDLVKGLEETISFQDKIFKNTVFFESEESRFSALIITDDSLLSSIMSNYLRSLKMRSVIVESGTQGLKSLELDSSFDVVIIESMLYDMSGYELCRAIRKNFSIADLPILILTASNRMDEVFSIFENGANDYITKPFDKTEFLVRINLLISYKSAMLERQKISTMEKELKMAKKIQDSLLPKKIPSFDDARFGTLYLPMSMVGGDYYDIQKISEHSFSVLVADVSGHGVPAALIASMLKIALQHNQELLPYPAKLFNALNQDLSNNLDNNFLTATYAVFDLQEKTVVLSSAGHPPVLQKSEDSAKIKELKTEGLIIGFDKSSKYKEMQIDLTPNDRFVFYSDGITEINAANQEDISEKEEYGDGKFYDFIQLTASIGAQEFVPLLVENLFDYSGMDSFDDDLTMVVVDYRPQ